MKAMTGHKIKLNLFVFALLFSFLFLAPLSVNAKDTAQVRDIRYWSSNGYTRVVINLSETVEYTKRRLSNPDRLFFDLKSAHIQKEIKTNFSVGDGILKSIRAGQYATDTVRVVLDLETMEDFNVIILEDPVRLIIDVKAKRLENKEEKTFQKKRVILDPGHGGHDPGAVGKGGLREKDVVLDIALKVRDILSNDPSLDIYLTRDKDVFIPLEERTALAMKKDADLFVSVHANASPNRKAKGIETYLLNWTNDEEAIRVAARENAISVRTMKEKMKKYRNDLDTILSDLRRDYKRDESLKLANYVQTSLVTDVGKIHTKTANLGVKQAFFYVLVGASMPSVLAEVSFISNPDEERLLSNEDYRSVIARSIASGITTYFQPAVPVQKIADLRKER